MIHLYHKIAEISIKISNDSKSNLLQPLTFQAPPEVFESETIIQQRLNSKVGSIHASGPKGLHGMKFWFEVPSKFYSTESIPATLCADFPSIP